MSSVIFYYSCCFNLTYLTKNSTGYFSNFNNEVLFHLYCSIFVSTIIITSYRNNILIIQRKTNHIPLILSLLHIIFHIGTTWGSRLIFQLRSQTFNDILKSLIWHFNLVTINVNSHSTLCTYIYKKLKNSSSTKNYCHCMYIILCHLKHIVVRIYIYIHMCTCCVYTLFLYFTKNSNFT